jgi:hypothetical protein
VLVVAAMRCNVMRLPWACCGWVRFNGSRVCGWRGQTRNIDGGVPKRSPGNYGRDGARWVAETRDEMRCDNEAW